MSYEDVAIWQVRRREQVHMPASVGGRRPQITHTSLKLCQQEAVHHGIDRWTHGHELPHLCLVGKVAGLQPVQSRRVVPKRSTGWLQQRKPFSKALRPFRPFVEQLLELGRNSPKTARNSCSALSPASLCSSAAVSNATRSAMSFSYSGTRMFPFQ